MPTTGTGTGAGTGTNKTAFEKLQEQLEKIRLLSEAIKKILENLGFGNKYSAFCQKLDEMNENLAASAAANEATYDTVEELYGMMSKMKGQLNNLTPENADEVVRSVSEQFADFAERTSKTAIVYDKSSLGQEPFDGWCECAKGLGKISENLSPEEREKLQKDFELNAKLYIDKDTGDSYVQFNDVIVTVNSSVKRENDLNTLKIEFAPCDPFDPKTKNMEEYTVDNYRATYKTSLNEAEYNIATASAMICDKMANKNGLAFYISEKEAQNALMKLAYQNNEVDQNAFLQVKLLSNSSNGDYSMKYDRYPDGTLSNDILIRNRHTNEMYVVSQENNKNVIIRKFEGVDEHYTMSKANAEKAREIAEITQEGDNIKFKYVGVDVNTLDDLKSPAFCAVMKLVGVDETNYLNSLVDKKDTRAMWSKIKDEHKPKVEKLAKDFHKTLASLSNGSDYSVALQDITLTKPNGRKAGKATVFNFADNNGNTLSLGFDENGVPVTMTFKGKEDEHFEPVFNIKNGVSLMAATAKYHDNPAFLKMFNITADVLRQSEYAIGVEKIKYIPRKPTISVGMNGVVSTVDKLFDDNRKSAFIEEQYRGIDTAGIADIENEKRYAEALNKTALYIVKSDKKVTMKGITNFIAENFKDQKPQDIIDDLSKMGVITGSKLSIKHCTEKEYAQMVVNFADNLKNREQFNREGDNDNFTAFLIDEYATSNEATYDLAKNKAKELPKDNLQKNLNQSQRPAPTFDKIFDDGRTSAYVPVDERHFEGNVAILNEKYAKDFNDTVMYFVDKNEKPSSKNIASLYSITENEANHIFDDMKKLALNEKGEMLPEKEYVKNLVRAAGEFEYKKELGLSDNALIFLDAYIRSTEAKYCVYTNEKKYNNGISSELLDKALDFIKKDITVSPEILAKEFKLEHGESNRLFNELRQQGVIDNNGSKTPFIDEALDRKPDYERIERGDKKNYTVDDIISEFGTSNGSDNDSHDKPKSKNKNQTER